MTSLLSKVILGSVALVGGGTSAWGSYLIFFKPKTIEENLTWNKFRALDFSSETTSQSPSDYEKWTEIIGKWDSDSELQTFVGQVQDNRQDNRLPALKNKCKSTLKEAIEDKKYENAKKYCAVEIS